MKLILNRNYFILFFILFIIEALIASFLKEGFIRHTVGDFLVVILLYCLFKSFVRTDSFTLVIITLTIAFAVEFLQLTDFLKFLGLEHNKWANLVFGNTFSVKDLAAYTLGGLIVIFAEGMVRGNGYEN